MLLFSPIMGLLFCLIALLLIVFFLLTKNPQECSFLSQRTRVDWTGSIWNTGACWNRKCFCFEDQFKALSKWLHVDPPQLTELLFQLCWRFVTLEQNKSGKTVKVKQGPETSDVDFITFIQHHYQCLWLDFIIVDEEDRNWIAYWIVYLHIWYKHSGFRAPLGSEMSPDSLYFIIIGI